LGKGKTDFDLDHFGTGHAVLPGDFIRYPKTDAAPEAQYYLGVAKYKASHDPKELKVGIGSTARDYPNSE